MKRLIKLLMRIFFVLYCLILIYLLFLKSGPPITNISISQHIIHSTNLIPFKTILMYFKRLSENTINTNTVIYNLLGNFVIFMPMSFFISYNCKRIKSVKHFIAAVFILVLAVEILQILTQTGSFDIDDFILNISGALLFYVLLESKKVKHLLRKVFPQ